MRALIFMRLVDQHDGHLAIPVLGFYLGVLLAFFHIAGAVLIVACLLALAHKRHVNAKYDSRLEALKSMSEALKSLQERLDKVEPKLSRVANKLALVD